MEQSSGKLNHWLAFYLCKGLGIKTLLALSEQHSLASLFSLSHAGLVNIGLTAHQASNLLNTNWQQVAHYEQLISQQNIVVISIFDNTYPEHLSRLPAPRYYFFVKGIPAC